MPFEFEPNWGQFPSAVSYKVRTRLGSLALGAQSIPIGRSVRLSFAGDKASAWEAMNPARGTTSYRIGNDPKLWISNVTRFLRLRRDGAYAGIGIDLYLIDGNLEYDFLLDANADPGQIWMRFDGADNIAIDSAGNLVIDGPDGRSIQRKPVSYQGSGTSKRLIPTRYRILSRTGVGVEMDEYDRSAPLTIDPIVESVSLLGGSMDDTVMGIGTCRRHDDLSRFSGRPRRTSSRLGRLSAFLCDGEHLYLWGFRR